MTCEAGRCSNLGPSTLKASALPIELTWQTDITFRTTWAYENRLWWCLHLWTVVIPNEQDWVAISDRKGITPTRMAHVFFYYDE